MSNAYFNTLFPARSLHGGRAHDEPLLLADALLRQARVTGDPRLTSRAGAMLSVVKDAPGHYDALRMLGAIYLSQHRFGDALDVGRRARDLRPSDPWNHGVIGDALLELGEYEDAFEAFDTMMSIRPTASAYARVAYARELQGNVHGALQAMQMVAEATSVHDPEAQAWYASQVGELYLRMGKSDDADRIEHKFIARDLAIKKRQFRMNGSLDFADPCH